MPDRSRARTSLFTILSLVLSTALAMGCAGSPSSERALPSTGNPVLDAALAKEIELSEVHVFEAPSGDYSISLPLPFEHSLDDNIDRFDMHFGDSDTWVSCYVFESNIDLGATAVRLGNIGIEQIEAAIEVPIASNQITDVRGGAIAGGIYHGAEWLAVSSEGSGQPKAWAANRLGRGIGCLHLGLGYRETTFRVFEHLVSSYAPTSPPPEPYFEEIQVIRTQGLVIGVEGITLTFDADGDTEIFKESSVLLPRGGADAIATRSSARSWARPDGTLINAIFAESDIDELKTELTLQYNDGQGWKVEGTFESKELTHQIDSPETVDSNLSEYLAMGQRLVPHGEDHEVTLSEWVPSVDPTSFLTAKLRVPADEPNRLVVDIAGTSLVEGERDSFGFLSRGTATTAGTVMEFETVHQRGGL